jgi:hypothetical protein
MALHGVEQGMRHFWGWSVASGAMTLMMDMETCHEHDSDRTQRYQYLVVHLSCTEGQAGRQECDD